MKTKAWGALMFLEEITQLTNYMSAAKRSTDDICRFLVVNSFRRFSPRAIYVGQVNGDGNLALNATFGFNREYINQFRELPLNLNIPVIEAVRSDEIIYVESREIFLERYPEVKSLGTIDDDWNSAVAVPIQSNGAYFLVLHGIAENSSEVNYFLKTISNLIALSFDEPVPVLKTRQGKMRESKPLTPRQELIKSLLAKGFTNSHIASEIGYSESLVRQETIAIYAALNISGREELIKAEDNSKSKA